MKFRRLFLLALVFAAFALPASALPPTPTPPDVTVLIRTALSKVTHTKGFSKAILRDATGTTTGGGNTTTAAGFTNWTFVFDNSATPGATHKSATLIFAFDRYPRGTWGKVTGGPGLGFGPVNITALPVMTLTHALQIIRRAHDLDGFNEVELVDILSPGPNQPEYIFQTPTGEAIVGTRTAAVTIIPSD